MTESESEQEMQHEKAELAKALPRLTPEQLAHVSPHLVRESYRPGQTIMKQGDPPDRYYVLVSGRVEIWHEDLTGDQHLVATIYPGDYFGETGLLHNHPRSATVRVCSDGGAEVLALDRQHFLAMIDESKATDAQVAREMVQRLIELSEFQD